MNSPKAQSHLGYLDGLPLQNQLHIDPQLEELNEDGRLCNCGAFMHAVQQGDFGRSRTIKQVQEATTMVAINNVAAAFVESGRHSPIIDS